MSKDFIHVSPAAHYSMGGIKTNVEGQTSVRGLFAIGEVASTGLHGANRLASNSLLECVVCAYELANYLTFANLVTPKQIDENIKAVIDKYSNENTIEDTEINVDNIKAQLQDIMWNNVGIFRDEKSLNLAKSQLKELSNGLFKNPKCSNRWEYELKNMFTVANLIIDFALTRKESRGAHQRLDYAFTKEIAEHTCMTKGSIPTTVSI